MSESARESESGDADGLDRVIGASSVLLLAPEGSAAKPDGCERLLADASASTSRVLGVAYRPDEEACARLAVHGDRDVERTVVGVEPCPAPAGVETAVVPDGASLVSHVRERVRSFDDAGGVVCFDALAPLLDDLGLVRTFQFLNNLLSDVRDRNATLHVHFDPESAGSQALDAITTTFDAVARSGDGERWDVAWRRHSG